MWHRTAAGTLICRERDMTDVLMTSIVLKTNVTLMDIVSTRMLGQYGFLSKVGLSCMTAQHEQSNFKFSSLPITEMKTLFYC